MGEPKISEQKEYKLIPCPDCEGTGEVEIGLTESFASQRTDQRYEKVKCETCNGEGWVEA